MKIFTALDPKDRKMLAILLGMVALFIALLALFTPAEDPNKNPVPDSYLTGQHGARAAYTLLERSGYAIQRWEQPLAELATRANPQSVLILAEPFSLDSANNKAIADFLRKGGRVLSTGPEGGYLLPGNRVTFSKGLGFAACEAQPDGLAPLAGDGNIFIIPAAAWKDDRPEVHTAYTCAGQPVVVEYEVGAGHAVWWASSTPLENGSITRGKNLELLLNSVGPPREANQSKEAGQPRQIYWDESLHGQRHTAFEYTVGPTWTLLWSTALGLTLLMVLSFSRRSGPVRPLPQAPRTTPIEFLDALGGLYRSTGATSTAVQIAWERFRSQAGMLIGARQGSKGVPLDARQLTAAIARRYGTTYQSMEADLIAAEDAASDSDLKPGRALAIVQSLRRHEETLRKASSSSRGSALPGALRTN
jgi:hypothetical protein